MATHYKMKQGTEPVCCSDVYYDLFDGGYLPPSNNLEKEEDIKEVKEAMTVINTYISDLYEAGILQEM